MQIKVKFFSNESKRFEYAYFDKEFDYKQNNQKLNHDEILRDHDLKKTIEILEKQKTSAKF